MAYKTIFSTRVTEWVKDGNTHYIYTVPNKSFPMVDEDVSNYLFTFTHEGLTHVLQPNYILEGTTWNTLAYRGNADVLRIRYNKVENYVELRITIPEFEYMENGQTFTIRVINDEQEKTKLTKFINRIDNDKAVKVTYDADTGTATVEVI